MVFCTRVGAPIHHCALTKEFKSILSAAELSQQRAPVRSKAIVWDHFPIAGVDSKTVSQEAGRTSVAFHT